MSKSPEERKRWIEFVSAIFVSRLPAPDWAEEIEIDEDEISRSEKTLAAVYRDLGFPIIWTVLVLITSLLAIDVLFFVPSQVYGLYIDVFAAIFFLSPSLKSAEDIAAAVTSEERAVRIKEAQEMVANNVGFLTLLCGFGIQGLALQSQRTELIGENFLASLPGFLVYLALPLAGVFAFYVLGWTRSRYREERPEGYPNLMGESD